MVLSGSKKTTYMSSIVNANQGGGSKKAGSARSIGLSSWSSVALRERGDGILSMKNMQTARFKMFPNQNLPVGFNANIRMY
jgi:hypothetical protein